MNEIFGRLQVFTNKNLNAETMLIKIIITYSLARFFFIITSNGSRKNVKKNYSKILSQCSRCFEGMNLEVFLAKNQEFFHNFDFTFLKIKIYLKIFFKCSFIISVEIFSPFFLNHSFISIFNKL